MSISFSGSTLTFSDSTTMTTASVAGPPGPTGSPGSAGSTGPTGPTGAAGTNASVVTTYGAVGSYVVALGAIQGTFSPAAAGTVNPGCTIGGACLSKCINGTSRVSSGLNLNSCGGTLWGRCIGNPTSLSLSGTWRAMTTSQSYGNRVANLWVRVS